ncbi:alpha/beta fold hydrolase [Agromyces intestinalis]|uniref:Alpha/beta fold hydrolase n=1 Tax=Agromyces intestinalis TaxID=2592652 RepID=A0A5C1YD23_9MICO|nr:alpha/beta fold hydrolase [Agromyces intestinalis]QEO13089.1 alpha/beta fold hydrolase [Agromyces intestinalis]
MSDDLFVRYVEFDGTPVAWAATGSGPALVVAGWWCSHLRLNWADAGFRDYLERLGRHRTVIRYDRPGTGLSGGAGAPPATLEAEYRALAGLVDALQLDSFTLLAGSSGCAAAAVYAARHPGRVEKLVLCGGYARGADISPPAVRDTLIAATQRHWGLGSRVLADLFLPESTWQERAEFAEFQRRCTTADQAAASLKALYTFDCSAELGEIGVPTLVLHRRDDRAIRLELGRELAAAIPHADFVVVDGANHFPWRGDRVRIANEVIAFLTGTAVERRVAPPVRPVQLSGREREVLALTAQGMTDPEIAKRLLLSPHTVHRHMANIRTKLGVSSRAAAAVWATAHGVL